VGKNNGKKDGPDLPYSKEQVAELIDSSEGNIVAAAKSIDVPYKTFYSWIDKYGLKPYPDHIKKRIATAMFEKARQLALKNNSEPMIKEVLKKWGHMIEFNEPTQKVEVTQIKDPGQEPYEKPKDLIEQRNESLGVKGD